MNKGIELWKRAKQIIPGGSQLLSKRSEQFLPGHWPSYYQKAKGIEIWDLDNNRFVDFSLMGIGACILGYADDYVDKAVEEAIDKGSMATLNCPEEVELAELLLKLHTWATMVRYARTGGEAMVVAVRIARAHTKKDQVAFCGYHGWHDWYLSANLANAKNLDGQLLPGLEPNGVPRGLKGTALPFSYNRIDELENIVSKNNIGTIVVEPVRHRRPERGFLEKVRKIANDTNAALVFDEITCGWRMNVGGIHELYKVNPDIVVYAKAMSNGFPMAAIVGNEAMSEAENSFISSTCWTERVGPTAAIATINRMQDENVPSHLCRLGNAVGIGLKKLAQEHNLEIEIMDAIPPLMTFSFLHIEDQTLRTLFTQEMLSRGFLASNNVYLSYAHSEDYVRKYLETVDTVFGIIMKSIRNKTMHKLLKGPAAKSGFRRLTE